MDKILLNNLQFYGFHGLLPEENRLGQRFQVDVVLYANLQNAGQTDNMMESIHYGEAYSIVQKIVEGEAKNLIEAVAEEIAQALLQAFEKLQACTVKVIKPDPPIPGHYTSVAVEIHRERKK